VLAHELGGQPKPRGCAVSGRASPFSTGTNGLTGQPVARGEKNPSLFSKFHKLQRYHICSTFQVFDNLKSSTEFGKEDHNFTHKFVQIFNTSIVQVFNIKVMKQKQL
jgi:hypothetical protein